MSRLSDAIDANRTRTEGQSMGAASDQGTGSTKTGQTSSRMGGGSVLSQAIDQTRSGETVERATGVQLPQSFWGMLGTQRSGVSTTPSATSASRGGQYRNQNTAFERSGLSRDEFDSRVRGNQQKTTGGGFYSMPDFGAETERLESAARTAQTAMQQKETELEANACDYEKYSALYAEKEQMDEELLELMERWERLSEEAEGLE